MKEATFSPTALRNGITNMPDAATLVKMRLVAEKCFEPLRDWYGEPIKINSFYRCPELNKLVGGSTTSQHMKGEAIDIDAGSREENRKIFNWCIANLEFDQVINEFSYAWIHISYREGNNRNQNFAIV